MTDEYPEYLAFLKSKVRLAESWGFEVAESEINPALKPHQRASVRWMVGGGRRALFKRFGLGKSVCQLEAVRLTLAHARLAAGPETATRQNRGLIVCPLGVRQEFQRDAREILGWCDVEIPKFIRTLAEASTSGIYLTNYESVRDGKLDPAEFTVVSLDEAAILRGFGGSKTFRELMRLCTGDGGPSGNHRTDGKRVNYRFVATATPSPNEYIELLAYAEFLGIMDVSQAKTRFFKRDSTKADNLTIHPHKEREFWLWVASWALFVQKPSDLGFSDEGYALPPMEVHWHEVATDHSNAGHDRSGQAKMFRDASIGVQDAASEKRSSLPARIAKMLEIRASDPAAHRVIWHDLEAEREAIEDALPRRRFNLWEEYKDGHPDGLALYNRHYSARQYADGRARALFCGPGEKMVLLTAARDALFVWRRFVDDCIDERTGQRQRGLNCAVFRNESPTLASDLIREAMAIAWQEWPGERLYTYVDGDSVRSTNPGCCFKLAGWTQCGTTKNGKLVFEVLPGAEVPAVAAIPGIVTVCGTDTDEHKEDSIIGFSDGAFPEIAGKPSMLGCGVNWQRHCARAVYLGIGFKFHEFIQSVHRIYRFLQTKPVHIDLIYTEAERGVRKQLEQKWTQHNHMVEKMTEIIREFGLSQVAMAQTLTRKLGIERIEIAGPSTGSGQGPSYRLVNNDCVLETRRMATNSVGLVLTSIPFSSQYEYSPNYADFGHSEGNAEFFEQMDFLSPELFRVLQPGRIAAIHVKDRIVPGGMTGLGCQTVYPFHSRCIDHYMRHGFAYMGMITVVTDVVRENNQTYRLGWTEQCKDGTKMGVGMPEYLLLFRKPPTDRTDNYADAPVVKKKPLVMDAERGAVAFGDGLKPGQKEKRPIIPGTGYSRAKWQVDAHALWRSSGDRLLRPEELLNLEHDQIFQLFRRHSLERVYDFEHHVRIGEEMERTGRLPVTFMLLQPQSWHDEVWTDITRMRTLNTTQAQKGAQMHLCPMQRDLADRVIERFSMAGDVVYDPFAGLGTVPLHAILKQRVGWGAELNPVYFTDACSYLRMAAEEMATPTLFDVAQFESSPAEPLAATGTEGGAC